MDTRQYSALGTIVDLLRTKAVRHPARRAYAFLSDGENEQVSFTYAEIDLRAQAIGSWLRSFSTTGDRVLLLYPSGPEFVAAFFGCLYSGAIAVPAYPLDSARMGRTSLRLKGIVKDARPVVGLTCSASLGLIEDFVRANPELSGIRWIATENIALELASDWTYPPIYPDSLAILQYTSGSTANPKGVMLSHSNILENERMIQEVHGYSETNTFVGWIPLAHDWGLINYVLQPLYLGASSVLMPPEAFLQRPARWLQAISRYKNVTSGGPGFAYELCIDKIDSAERQSLNLETWICAGIGASPVRHETLDRFSARFGECGFRRQAFYAGYGLAEATLLVTDSQDSTEPRVLRVQKSSLEQNDVVVNPPQDLPSVNIVGCGRAPSTERILIVEPQLSQICPPGKVGEIWVSGAHVAQGYWNNPGETHDAFHAFLRGSGEGPFLRTGDLGFLDDGELFVTGRLKDLIIVRGRNLYPEDIELTVERCHKSLRPGCTIAFSIQAEFDEQLVIVQEVRGTQQESLIHVIGAIREAVLREHQVLAHAVVLVKERSILKTSSGKLQRQTCRSAYLSGSLQVVEQDCATGHRSDRQELKGFVRPRTPVEEKLARIWSQALKVQQIGIHDRFFDLGGDSLAAAQCLIEIRDEFALQKLTPEIFLSAPTVAEMAQAISDPVAFSALEPEVLLVQSNESEIPLVLVFPGMECQSISRRLGSDRPVLGISSVHIDRLPGAPPSIERIASECVLRLRRHLPNGPYALGGWCASGIVALEMARQLEEDGTQVAFVALFDARDGFLPPMNHPRRVLVHSWRFLQRIGFFVSKIRRRGMRFLWQRAVAWSLEAREVTGRLVGRSRSRSNVLIEALRDYQPKPWQGRVIHFWATERPKGAFRSPEFICRQISPDGFVFHEVQGDHISMLHEPNVGTLADILASELNSAPMLLTNAKCSSRVSDIA